MDILGNLWLQIGAVFVMLSLGLLVARLTAIVRAGFRAGKLRRAHTIIAVYDAPERFTPGELGYIIDAVFGSNELLATVAWLYSVGLVRLQPDENGRDFIISASTDENIVPIGDAESSVLGYIRSLANKSIRWSELDTRLGSALGLQADFEQAVLDSLVGKGLLYRGGVAAVLFRKRAGAAVFATLATTATGAPIFLWAHGILRASIRTIGTGYMGIDRGVSIMLLVPAIIALWLGWYTYTNLLIYVYIHRNGVPLGGTRLLNELWPQVAGYQLFLRETEYVRLQHDRNTHDPSMAYCLALGLDPGFVRSLKS